MTVSLKKGQRIDLRKSDGGGLRKVIVGLGWDAKEQPRKGGLFGLFSAPPPDFDCDASVVLCQNGRLAQNGDLIYYGNRKHFSQAVEHMGDNMTGAGEGDDEQIKVDLTKLPAEYDKLVFIVNIYQATQRNQHFGMINNAYIRIVDEDNNMELCRFNLTDDYSGKFAMIFGELYRKDGGWKFNAIGEGTTDTSLVNIARRIQ